MNSADAVARASIISNGIPVHDRSLKAPVREQAAVPVFQNTEPNLYLEQRGSEKDAYQRRQVPARISGRDFDLHRGGMAPKSEPASHTAQGPLAKVSSIGRAFQKFMM